MAVSGVAWSGSRPARAPRNPSLTVAKSHPSPGTSARKAPTSPAAPAGPVFDATSMGSPILLDKGWRVGITSNLAAATTQFDDSAWAIRDAKSLIEEVSEEAGTGDALGPAPGASPQRRRGRLSPRRYAWFRLHIKLAPNHGPVALLIRLPVSHNTSISIGTVGPGADVFANGKQIHPEGPHGDAPQHYQQISRIYNLNLPPSETSLTLVVRTLYIPFGFSSYTSFFANRSLILGHPADLERSLKLWSNNTLFERLPRLVAAVLLVALAAFLLALYFVQKGHIEYLWLALHELLQAPIAFIELAGSSARLDSLWYAASSLQLVVISAYLYFEFLIAFLSLRRRWYIQTLRFTAPILAGVGPTLLMVGHSRSIGIALLAVFLGSSIWIAGWSIFVLITLTAATVRRNFEAGLLLFPLLLSFVGIIEPVVTEGMTDWTGHPYHSPLTIQAGPIPIHFSSIADYTGIIAIVLIIFFRFLRIHRERERAASELAAARSMQELMIPQEKVATPGFEVDSVYSPAHEVGGDFFHVQAGGDGGLLVVIGDVAGKGLKAAMSVSMLIGALRHTTERNPARILNSLNRVLAGNESFTTCMAAWFGDSGEVVLASAGHLPPYLNSQEITLPGGLPLGVVPEAGYEEVRIYLHPGDRLLLISDGVVEARQSSGEIFGFDRMHNLSNQSAYYVAEAAKSFGQEDDITVLSVKRLAQPATA